MTLVWIRTCFRLHTVDSCAALTTTHVSTTPNWSDRAPLMSPTSSQLPSDRVQPQKDEQDGKEDLFATLFSPPTPPASPLPTPVFDTTVATSSSRQQSSRRSRSFSISSGEFGSFVSVPARDDPLYADQGETFSPISGLEFFDQFTEHAVKSNAQKRQVLDELLLHEDDPLYWVDDDTSGPAPPDVDVHETENKSSSERSHSPVPPIPEEPDSPIHRGRSRAPDRFVNKLSEPKRHLTAVCIYQVRRSSILKLQSIRPRRPQSQCAAGAA